MRPTVPSLLGVLVATSLATSASAATGGLPVSLSHGGYLLDAADHPLTTTASLVFRVFATATGGTPEWEGTCADVAVKAGYYSVALGGAACTGSGGALDPSLDSADLPAGATRWLEVEIGGLVLTPRVVLAAVPSAVVASLALDAGTLQGRLPGTAAGNLLALDAQARLPAVDGSLLSGVVAANVGGSTATAVNAAAVAVAGASSANTAGALVVRDSSGAFAGGALTASSLRVTGGATAGHVLTSDASGNATWAAPSGGGSGGLPDCSDGQTILRSGGAWICSPTLMAAGGNTITQVAGKYVHTFTSSGNFHVNVLGGTVEIEMIGGGAGGGSGSSVYAAGGGGGGYVRANFGVAPGQSYAVVVGAAGAGQTACDNAQAGGGGGSSSFAGSLLALGGTGGGQVGEAAPGGGVIPGAVAIVLNSVSGSAGGSAGGEFASYGGNNGGGPTWGTGAAGVPNYTPGIHAAGNGNGGSGGPSCQNGHRGGGNGSPGIVIIRYPM